MKLFKRILLAILVISVFVVTRLFIQDVKPLFKNLVDETIANPLDKDFLTEKFEGLTIKYEKNDYSTVETIKALYPEAKEELDKLYGDNSDELTIVVYEKLEDFNAASKSENLGGYYIPINDSIHLKSEELVGDFPLEDTFFHEYTHYRTDSFLEKHGLSDEDLPQWFNEGISEVIAKRDTDVDIDLVETIDFNELDSNTEFLKGRQGDVDPYLQSYFTVNELVYQYGLEILPEILLALKDKDIYKVLDDIVGTNSDELLSSYIARREVVKEMEAQAHEYELNANYKKALEVYEEILHLHPSNVSAIGAMPHLLVKQFQFTKAMDTLKNRTDLYVYELKMLAELSLLTDLNESLKYTEMSEEKLKVNINDSSYKSPIGEIIRNNSDDPVGVFLELMKENLITYEEIKLQLEENLKKMYPDDPRVQNL
ncbi:hypothetical protein EKG37_07160 [Robertmurraya yapensis]|uniref:Uncharacterized protein n=1 Tax=Bacillus yapensis TaxID=2492960 RepID=A0A3S0KMB9_9BACI|nr:hypothetical protein [Bacillus yapensis]RTR33983.1 hypothetical protein EKG37_07160 [Bacillus yapensis]TKS97301.1 hypothetical protein FAR12_07160 [Bacillus yapensis]